MKKIINQPFFIILGAAFVIRLVFFLYSSYLGENTFYLVDSYRYINLGNNYFNSGIYAEEISDPLFPSIFIPPGLPTVFYLLNAIGGVHLIIVFQIICQLFIGYILLKTYKLLFNPKTNFSLYLIGFLYAFDLPSIILGNVLMGETVFTLFLLLFIQNFIRFILNHQSKHLLLSSLFLGIATLIKPIAFYLPILFFIYLFFHLRKEKSLNLSSFIYFLFPFYLLTGFWMARNYAQHQTVFYSYQSNFNLFYFQAASIYGQNENLPLQKARVILFEELKNEFPPQKHFDQIEFYDKAGEKAVHIILSSPHLLLKNMMKANVNLFVRPVRDYLKINWGSNELFHTRSKNNNGFIQFITYWQILLNCILTLLIPFGFIYFYTANRKICWALLLFLGYFMLTCSGPEVEARFRVPIFPVILLLSIGGITFILEKIQKRKSTLQ